MLRKSSTQAVANPDNHRFGTVRSTPMIDPTTSAITQADSDSDTVHLKPVINQPR